MDRKALVSLRARPIRDVCHAVQNLVPPYLDALIQKLLSLLQNGQKVVQEGALTAMASVADCAKDSFAKYYTEVSVVGPNPLHALLLCRNILAYRPCPTRLYAASMVFVSKARAMRR